MIPTTYLVLGASLLLPLAASCQQITVALNPAATKINWTLGGNIHTVHGTFQLKEGRVTLDQSTGNASGELIVEAGSGESGNPSRDRRMLHDVLEIEKFPDVRLKVTRLEGTLPLKDNSSARLLGQFIIHGTSHEVSIPLKITLNASEVSGRGKLVVPYLDWGMRDPSNFLFRLNKTVEVEFMAVGHVARAN